ncbi:maturation, partial [Leviviridae sp.]
TSVVARLLRRCYMEIYAYYNALPYGVGASEEFQLTVCFPLSPEATGVSSKFTSRGLSPNFGDGPYFISHVMGHPIGVYMSPSHVDFTYEGNHVIGDRTGLYTAQYSFSVTGRLYKYEWIVNKNADDDYDIKEIQDHFIGDRNVYHWETTHQSVIKNRFPYVTKVGWEPGVFNFLQSEYEVFQAAVSLGIYLAPYATLWSSAYVDAVDQIPKISVNAVEGILDAIDTLRGIYYVLTDPIHALRDFIHGVKDWGNDWLSYRYVYTTTKLDINSVKEGMRAISKVKSLMKEEYSVTGRAKDGLISVGVKVTFKMCDIIPDSYEELFRQYGLVPSAYDMWDIIPFSFMVDWFAQLGDILELFGKFSNTLRYRPTQTWFTAVTVYQNQTTFFRVPGTRLSIPPKYEFREVSDKTLAMRITDFVAIFKP